MECTISYKLLGQAEKLELAEEKIKMLQKELAKAGAADGDRRRRSRSRSP